MRELQNHVKGLWIHKVKYGIEIEYSKQKFSHAYDNLPV